MKGFLIGVAITLFGFCVEKAHDEELNRLNEIAQLKKEVELQKINVEFYQRKYEAEAAANEDNIRLKEKWRDLAKKLEEEKIGPTYVE